MTVVLDASSIEAGCVLVPTMGAIHAGHAELVRLARREADLIGASVVVSVFVNPTQFNESADFERYPRTLERDAAACAEAGADAVYAPTVEAVYPDGADASRFVVPSCAVRGLEDAHRPGHFPGVCMVCDRLFELTRCTAAVFGEKDWQQLQVIRAMVADGPREVRILPGETVREQDGLAMSSRNVFLDEAQRIAARSLSQGLCDAASAGTVGEGEAMIASALGSVGLTADYATIREAKTLDVLPAETVMGSVAARALVAARVGVVRLLDNAAWGDRPGYRS